MLKYVRDSLSVCGLVRQLEYIRNDQLLAGVSGQVAPADWLGREEEKARARNIAHYFSPGARQLMGEPGGPAPARDAADAEARTCKMGEEMAILTHRALVAIPWVGHPDFADITPPDGAPNDAFSGAPADALHRGETPPAPPTSNGPRP